MNLPYFILVAGLLTFSVACSGPKSDFAVYVLDDKLPTYSDDLKRAYSAVREPLAFEDKLVATIS